MGLRFYIRRLEATGATWSYGGFMRFRERLAEEVGIPLREMSGYSAPGSRKPGWREWPHPNQEPLVPLLDHSDCEGRLTGEECADIESRLRDIVSGWPDDDYDKVKGLELADAMREVAAEDSELIFA